MHSSACSQIARKLLSFGIININLDFFNISLKNGFSFEILVFVCLVVSDIRKELQRRQLRLEKRGQVTSLTPEMTPIETFGDRKYM